MAEGIEIAPSIIRPAGFSLTKQWHVYTPNELPNRSAELGGGEHLVNDLLPKQSVGILVGDSGSGKSPLTYQLAISVAAGVPFLGHNVKQGRVLYMDHENGLNQIIKMQERLSRHLGLAAIPSELLVWSRSDSDPKWGKEGHKLPELVEAVRPSLVIVDTLSAQFPQAEARNDTASATMSYLRGLGAKYHVTFLCLHHLRKPNEERGMDRLEDANLTTYFNQVRGASALINNCDARLAVESSRGTDVISGNQEVALIFRGFLRVTGNTPIIRLARVHDEDGDPVGYSRVSGVALLENGDHRAAYEKLPSVFRFTDAKFAYGKGSQATTDFLKNCVSAGILRKTTKGYEKIEQALISDEEGGSSGSGG